MILRTLTDKETSQWLSTLTRTYELFKTVRDAVYENRLVREMAFTENYKQSKWRVFWYGLEDTMYKNLYITPNGNHQSFTGIWFKTLHEVPPFTRDEYLAMRYMSNKDKMDQTLSFLERSWAKYASIPLTPTEGDLEKYIQLEKWHNELTTHAKALGVYDEAYNLDEDRK